MLRTMLSAAEASMFAAAEDEAEAERIRARLYAPPEGRARGRADRSGAPGAGMNLGQAQAMMARLAAEDARFSG